MDPRTMNESQVHTGRTILTALYLCMLGVCFLVPIFFYFRMHCDDRRNRNLRDLEIAGMTQAMNESQAQQREESRAARKKYREERRARIIQLFTPVRMVRCIDTFQRQRRVCMPGDDSTEALIIYLVYLSCVGNILILTLYFCSFGCIISSTTTNHVDIDGRELSKK